MAAEHYRLGFLVGRFQMLHAGHEEIIRNTTELCDRTAVFVGSSQESGTAKNPFSYELREEMLKDIFKDSISVYPLPDLGAGNNSVWGRYVLENVVARTGEYPDLFVSGEEIRRGGWFPPELYPELTSLYIPKTVDISASRMREFIIAGDISAWRKYTDPALWDRYASLRETVLRCENITGTASI